MRQIQRVLTTACAVLVVTAVTFAQTTVAGEWSIEAETPHGQLAASLVLKQDGSKVAGSIAFPGGDPVPVTGEFAGGKLSLETAGHDGMSLGVKATVSGDSMNGYLSNERGDAKFTAVRKSRS